MINRSALVLIGLGLTTTVAYAEETLSSAPVGPQFRCDAGATLVVVGTTVTCKSEAAPVTTRETTAGQVQASGQTRTIVCIVPCAAGATCTEWKVSNHVNVKTWGTNMAGTCTRSVTKPGVVTYTRPGQVSVPLDN